MEPAADRWLIERGRARVRPPLRDLLAGHANPDVQWLLARVDELEDRLAASEPPPVGHLLFLGTPDRYELVESTEAPPPVGQLLIHGGRCFRVTGVRTSPLPRDRRPCLVAELDAVRA